MEAVVLGVALLGAFCRAGPADNEALEEGAAVDLAADMVAAGRRSVLLAEAVDFCDDFSRGFCLTSALGASS